jgi:hypothetical protein
MKFAFSTVACPEWDFETICARGKEYGYDGIEVRGFLNESILTASNIFLTDPAKLRSMLKYHGLSICCLASSIAMKGKKKPDRIAADDCRRYIDTAARRRLPFRQNLRYGSWTGHDRASAAIELGEWLMPLGDYAAARDIVIVVENALSFRSAKEMWLILDRLQHPVDRVLLGRFQRRIDWREPVYQRADAQLEDPVHAGEGRQARAVGRELLPAGRGRCGRAEVSHALNGHWVHGLGHIRVGKGVAAGTRGPRRGAAGRDQEAARVDHAAARRTEEGRRQAESAAHAARARGKTAGACGRRLARLALYVCREKKRSTRFA